MGSKAEPREKIKNAGRNERRPARASGGEGVEIALWAEELVFTVVRRGTDAGDPVLHVRLANVKARTRAGILDGMSPPVSRWAVGRMS